MLRLGLNVLGLILGRNVGDCVLGSKCWMIWTLGRNLMLLSGGQNVM